MRRSVMRRKIRSLIIFLICFCYVCGSSVFFAIDVLDQWPGISRHWWSFLVWLPMVGVGCVAIWIMERLSRGTVLNPDECRHNDETPGCSTSGQSTLHESKEHEE